MITKLTPQPSFLRDKDGKKIQKLTEMNWMPRYQA